MQETAFQINTQHSDNMPSKRRLDIFRGGSSSVRQSTWDESYKHTSSCNKKQLHLITG